MSVTVGNKTSREIICDSVYKPEALLANCQRFREIRVNCHSSFTLTKIKQNRGYFMTVI